MRQLRHLPLPRGLQNPHAEAARDLNSPLGLLSVGGLRAESWVRTCSLRSLRLIAMLSPGMNQTVAIEYLGEGALGAPLMIPTTLRLKT